MNMKKKVIAIALILVMVMCNCIMVYAAETITWNGTEYTGETSKNVSAHFEKASNTTTRNVDIIWGAMSFKYDGKVVWDGQEEGYVATSNVSTWTPTGKAAGDEVEANQIKIVNRSDVEVEFIMDYIPGARVRGAVGSIDGKDTVTEMLGSKAMNLNAVNEKTNNIIVSGVPTYIWATEDMLESGLVLSTILV